VIFLKRQDIRACILRVGGTNCDEETLLAFLDLGVKAEVIHMNYLLRGKRRLSDYHILVFPGGFSYGDHVRAGAIWGKKLVTKLSEDLKRFVEEDKAVLGICNGFQVLIESGLLPGFDAFSGKVDAVLATNMSACYECRWVFLKTERSVCKLLKYLEAGMLLKVPIGHGEGRFLTSDDVLKKLIDQGQVVFRYAKPDGSEAGGVYPYNPNGAVLDIAGICNPKGNVLGLMPHPERAYFGWQLPDWTSRGCVQEYGDGRLILESIVKYVEESF